MLAKINEDFPKIRDVISKEETNGMLNFMVTILSIKTTNDQDRFELDQQMILVFDLIRTKFGTLTIPEIKEAFKMYVSKEFPEIKVFRMLDCVSVGEILRAFTDFRNESLRVYDDKKRNLLNQTKATSIEERKEIRNDFLKHLFNDIKIYNFSDSAWLLFVDIETKLTTSNRVKKRLYKIQNKKYILELQNQVKASGKNPSYIHILERAQNNYIKGTLNSVVQNRCRSIVVCNYLKKFKTFEEFLTVIENI